MVVTCREMQEAEEQCFQSGVSAELLMDKAGFGCAEAISQVAREPGRAILFRGKGNNGGDALVAGSWLRTWGWNVEVVSSHPLENCSDLSRLKLAAFNKIANGHAAKHGPLVVVDGLLGIGSKGSPRGRIGEMADQLNELREKEGAICFAIDIPSGVDGDTGEVYPGAVMADHTLSICVPKKGIIAEEAVNHAGRIHSIPLPEIPVITGDESLRVLFPENLRPRLPRRPFDFHKGKAGRTGIIAGSKGLVGAAVLAASGALHGGGGLIFLFVPEEIYELTAGLAPPEVMVKPLKSASDLKGLNLDAVAIGPGLGEEIDAKVLEFALSSELPAVLDADLLNWIAKSPGALAELKDKPRLLTPHPGELRRLTGPGEKSKSGRIALTRELATAWNCTLLHKGARTVIASPEDAEQPAEINSTGLPAMASGGMGDVLTGLCGALLGQGLSLHDAACVGSWALGRAAELANPQVTASRVAASLGQAFAELR